MTPYRKALDAAERSYLAAKAARPRNVEQLLAAASIAPDGRRPDLQRAESQLREFKSWAYATINAIANRIAACPIMVGKRLASGEQRPRPSHPLLDLFADPIEIATGWTLMYSSVASLELTGRCLWWMPHNERILHIPTSWIVGLDEKAFEWFLIRPPADATEFLVESKEACWIYYPHPGDPIAAWSPLMAAAAAVNLDGEILSSQLAGFRNGIHPSTALVVGKDPHPDVPGGVRPRLTAEQQRQVVHAIMDRYGGSHQHGRVVVLDGLIEDVKRLSLTPAEMDWSDSEARTRRRILEIFGVPESILGSVENSNRASSFVSENHFLSTCVAPKIRLISAAMTEWIGRPLGVEIWLQEPVAHDSEMQLQWAQLLAKTGCITGDELRTLSPLGLQAAGFTEPVSQSGGLEAMLTDRSEDAAKRAALLLPPKTVAEGVVALIDRLKGQQAE